MLDLRLIETAIKNKISLSFDYDGRIRHASPHEYGLDKNGEHKLMTYQYGGDSSKPLPPDGEWRCLFLNKISNLKTNDDAWHTRNDHSRPNTCITLSVERVDC